MRLRGNEPSGRHEAQLTSLDIDDGLDVAPSFAGGTHVTFTIDRGSDERASLLSCPSDVVTDMLSWSDEDEG